MSLYLLVVPACLFPALAIPRPTEVPSHASSKRRADKARVGAETEAKAAADASAAEVPPADTPPADAGAAAPAANSPPTPAVAARLDAIAARLADLQAREAAYQQTKQINAVAVATTAMTVDQLEARAMGTPAGNQSARPQASQAPQSADEVEAASHFLFGTCPATHIPRRRLTRAPSHRKLCRSYSAPMQPTLSS